LLVSSVGLAQESATISSPIGRGGHSTPRSTKQVELIVRFITISDAELAKNGATPQSVVTDRTLTLAECGDPVPEAVNGIQLVSASTVVQRTIPVYISSLTEDKTNDLLKRVTADQRSNVLFAPKMIMRDGQISEIRDTSVNPYLTGFKGTGEHAEPQIEEIENGTRLVVRPNVQSDGSIRLNLAIRFSKVGDVTAVGDESSRSRVQVPEVHTSEIKLSADVDAGRTLVIGGVDKPRRGVRENGTWGWFTGSKIQPGQMERANMVLLLTPRIINKPDAD